MLIYTLLAEPLQVGIVQKLRQTFDNVNMKEPCMPLQDQGNPTKSIQVQEHIRLIRE